jgi:energy-coupling factor transporter ATP-binding protein EcfA2
VDGANERPHAIQIRDLWFRYPTADNPTLRGLTFDIREGEFVGILGPSGAGKSTLCQAIKGLIPHTTPGEHDGSVMIFGTDVTSTENSIEGARVGLVLQDPEAQIIGMTVREDLAFGPENYEVDPVEIAARSIACLEAVGLLDLMDRDTYTLSGGQKQRLAIASALMLEPDVLVLDEPTSELDPLGKDQVFAVLEALRTKRNITVIVVEHEIDRLARLADRIIVMNDGMIIADGTPLDVLATEGARERTAGERLPAAADFALNLVEQHFPERLRPTLDLDEAILDVERVLEGVSR